jgi:hypothetical protein
MGPGRAVPGLRFEIGPRCGDSSTEVIVTQFIQQALDQLIEQSAPVLGDAASTLIVMQPPKDSCRLGTASDGTPQRSPGQEPSSSPRSWVETSAPHI